MGTCLGWRMGVRTSDIFLVERESRDFEEEGELFLKNVVEEVLGDFKGFWILAIFG
jgi:hypothetical protein